ncbi:MAG: FHA domain-containing protein [Lacipirellulaceae bacterium]
MSASNIPSRASQRMLWIDGVGGYLLTTSDELLIGQPSAPGEGGKSPDLAVLADLSRRHATLRRETGAYVLTPHAPVWIDGRVADGPTVVQHGAELRLGSKVRVRFARPHALSATAILVVESGHRTAPAADAVILMAESCVLGPKPHSHIHCRGWQGEAILFRGADGLLCRAPGELYVAGKPVSGPVVARPGERIEGDEFSMVIEDVTA